MLKHLKVNNFKAWRSLDLQLGKVTGLFGTNSSGKSSILQFLLLLKQTKDATDRGLVLDFGGPNQLVNLGTYEAIVHRGDKKAEKAEIDWLLDWELPKPLLLGVPRRKDPFKGNRLGLSAQVGLEDSRPAVRHMKYRFSDTDFGIAPSERAGIFDLESRGGTPPFKFLRNKGGPGILPGPIKTYRFPDQARAYFQNTGFLSEFESQYESLMDRIFYLGPLREYPQRQYGWSGARPDGVGPRGERTVDAILAATASDEKWRLPSYEYKTAKFQAIVAHWLKELRLIHRFKIEEIKSGSNLYHARVKTAQDSAETMLTDVGFGVSQVLPVLVLLYYAPEGSVVLMEQPEIHLHPSVQSGLADVMIEVAKTRGVQIIVESHSEHLLRRFQRRVAEQTIPSSELRLYFVRRNQGEAELSDLRLNEWGDIEHWPDHFFGDELGEIAAISTAALDRQTKAEELKGASK